MNAGIIRNELNSAQQEHVLWQTDIKLKILNPWQQIFMKYLSSVVHQKSFYNTASTIFQLGIEA